MDHDPDRLHQLGAELRRIRAREKAIRPELYELIRAAAAAGVPQVEIVNETGYTRDQIRVICLPAEKRSKTKVLKPTGP